MQGSRPGLELDLARRVAASFAAMPEVSAVALGGSVAAGRAGHGSDVDLYVYAMEDVPVARRAAIAAGSRGPAELDNRSFEPGDEWVDGASGIHVDVMYRRPAWIEDQLERVLVRHLASTGYSTALWHNVRSSVALFDRDGWYARLRTRADVPYPEPLRRAIVARNQPLLRRNLSSYLRQIERGVARGDAPSVNHRVAAFLASWFDVLFAVNRVPHPGEKRLVDFAEGLCPRRPPGMADGVRALVDAIPGAAVAARADALGEALDELLREEGLLDAREVGGAAPGTAAG
jgi:hypothetical protein